MVGKINRRIRWAMVAAIVVLLAVGPLATAASADETDQPYAYLFVSPSSADGRLELSIRDVERVLNIDLGETDSQIKGALRDNEARLHTYAAEHFSLGVDGNQWPLSFSGVDLFRENSTLAFAVVRFTAEVPAAGVPTELEVRFDPFFDEVDGRDGLLLVNGGWSQGEYNSETEALVTFTGSSRAQDVGLGDRSQWSNFTSGITLGVDHIKTGPDHMGFILALLLPSVLIFSNGRWEPTDGFGSSLWRVLKIATFFTIAHSITFTLAGMGWLPQPPSKVVESIIAGSIAAAALHNLHPMFPNREWALSFVFGLFHGMGFASLVSNLEVSQTSQLVSLAGRNVGIEIGQVVVILAVFPTLFLLRRTTLFIPLLTIGSLALAALSFSWMGERVFEVDFGTNSLVDGFVQLPRAFVVMTAITALAAGISSRPNLRLAIEEQPLTSN